MDNFVSLVSMLYLVYEPKDWCPVIPFNLGPEMFHWKHIYGEKMVEFIDFVSKHENLDWLYQHIKGKESMYVVVSDTSPCSVVFDVNINL